MNKFLQDTNGSSIIENTVVLPIFMLLAFGTADMTYTLFEWNSANKAALAGARRAVVLAPVASDITNLTYTDTQIANLGELCFTLATGADNGNCPAASAVCTPTAGTSGSCTNGYTWNETPFKNADLTGILDQMQRVFPRLQRQNVQITYQTIGLGFVGRPNGLPMNVTVQIRCMTQQFYFLSGLMRWTFNTPPDGCPAGKGPWIPPFATTLTSEDMVSN